MTPDEIRELREQIIQVCIDNAYVETQRSMGDYDINITNKGSREIDKILGKI